MRGGWKGSQLLAVFLLAGALAPAARPAQAAERYFLIIFGAQRHPSRPRDTHTFATLIRVPDGCIDGVSPPIQAYTISWLPQTLKVRPFRCRSEPGYNLTLEETLHWAYANRLEVSEWGPYEIDEEFFQIVFNEYVRMESGLYRYKAIDPFTRGSRTTDCIHAVSDVDHLHSRAEYFFIRQGDAASRRIVLVLRNRERVLGRHPHKGILDAALGLDHYPIIHRPDP